MKISLKVEKTRLQLGIGKHNIYWVLEGASLINLKTPEMAKAPILEGRLFDEEVSINSSNVLKTVYF